MTNKQEWLIITEKRAMIYDWLSGLFAQELSDEQFSFYQNGKANEWFHLLCQVGLEKEVEHVSKAIKTWHVQGADPLDLRSDFAALFLLDSRSGAIPYASFYLEETKLMFGKMEERMRYFLSNNHLQISDDFKEPADHVSIYLGLMQQWVSNSIEDNDSDSIATEQSEFLQQALLSWLPEFTERCQNVNIISNFYPAIAELLLAFIQIDLEYLQSQSE
ncbi:MAG: molecular chaperone TorD [Gammaproteobacteria bacterium]|nr:molecular chaperone TorD [Gammaproteobacteria bacterium]